MRRRTWQPAATSSTSGTGTGQLAIEALTRWPALSVVGIDASGEMRAMADTEAARRLAPEVRERFQTTVAFADELPFPDSAFDLVLSSFVVQLVPNRARVLREVRRVLRPGATFAYVSWLQDERVFPPDDIFDDLLDELDIDPGDDDPGRPGDLPSVARAAGELRRAGFATVTARAGELVHPFTVDGYIGFMAEFHEESLIGDLDHEVRARFLGHAPRAARDADARAADDALSDRVRLGPPLRAEERSPGERGQPSDDSP